MQVATGTVVNGQVEVEGVALPEGALVAVVARGADEPFALSTADQEELLTAIAEIEPGGFVTVKQLLESLPKELHDALRQEFCWPLRRFVARRNDGLRTVPAPRGQSGRTWRNLMLYWQNSLALVPSTAERVQMLFAASTLEEVAISCTTAPPGMRWRTLLSGTRGARASPSCKCVEVRPDWWFDADPHRQGAASLAPPARPA